MKSIFIDHMFLGFTMLITTPLDGLAIYPYTAIFVWSVYLNKDVYEGRSLGKLMTRLQVIDIRSQKPASALKCLVRNVFIFIWPIEVVGLLLNSERRFGDFIAGTRVDSYIPVEEYRGSSRIWVILSFLLAMILTGTLFYFVEGYLHP